MLRLTTVAILAIPAALMLGCGNPTFTQPLVLGGKTVTAETLNAGREGYMLNCYACHGQKGDGMGPASHAFRPPPRDFRAGVFKFGGVAIGQLPNDEDLLQIVKRGLDGTPMLPWDVAEKERSDIIQYVKTFSDRWKTEKPGDRIMPSPDPWQGREAQAVERGKRVYHLSGAEKDSSGAVKGVLAGCNACHPSYLTRQETARLSQESLGAPPAGFSPDMYLPTLKESDYMVGEQKIQFLPIDFLYHRVKNGTSPTDLYRTIASGIGGTAMPTWKGVLKEDDLWALAHYVKTLVDARDTAQAKGIRLALASQPPWVPPPEPAQPAAPAGNPPAPKPAKPKGDL